MAEATPTNGRKLWEDIVHAWPVVVSIVALLWVLFVAFFEKEVQTVVTDMGVPTSQGFASVKAEVENLEETLTDDVSDNAAAIERVEGHVLRVEKKIDNFILLLQQQRDN